MVTLSVTWSRAKMQKMVTRSLTWSMDSETDGQSGVVTVALRYAELVAN